MRDKIIKRFVLNKITSLSSVSNVIDVLTLLDDYLLEIEKKIKDSKSDRLKQTQCQLKDITSEVIKIIENLTDKKVISYKSSPYKIHNLLKLIFKIKGSKEEYQMELLDSKLKKMNLEMT